MVTLTLSDRCMCHGKLTQWRLLGFNPSLCIVILSSYRCLAMVTLTVTRGQHLIVISTLSDNDMSCYGGASPWLWHWMTLSDKWHMSCYDGSSVSDCVILTLTMTYMSCYGGATPAADCDIDTVWQWCQLPCYGGASPWLWYWQWHCLTCHAMVGPAPDCDIDTDIYVMLWWGQPMIAMLTVTLFDTSCCGGASPWLWHYTVTDAVLWRLTRTRYVGVWATGCSTDTCIDWKRKRNLVLVFLMLW